jgi:hypothetical protein
MCDDFKWDNDDYEMREARRKFKSAMVQQFNDLYGTHEDLSSWKNLCRVLKIEPVPEGLIECRKVSICSFDRLRMTMISEFVRHLVDLVDTPRTGAPVKVFPNLKKLQDYTINSEKTSLRRMHMLAACFDSCLEKSFIHTRVRSSSGFKRTTENPPFQGNVERYTRKTFQPSCEGVLW